MQTTLPCVPDSSARPLPMPAHTSEACSRATLKLAAGIALGALGYAILRYVVLGDVAPAHLPLFVLNKAVAFTAAALLASCLAITPLMRVVPRLRPWGRLRKHLGLAGFGFAALHVVLTMLLLNPVYYAKLYLADGRMSLTGELALLCGVGAFAALCFPALTSVAAVKSELPARTWTRLQRLSLVALAAVGLHLVALGLPSWLAPAKWAGGLPPITLLAVLLVVAAFALRRISRRR